MYIKFLFSELTFILKNLNKIFRYIFFIFFKKIKKIKVLRKYYNPNNINSFDDDFDYIVTQVDDSILLLNKNEYKLYSNQALIKQTLFFDYYNYPHDSINKFLIKYFVKDGDKVVDVGTHIGLYSVYISKIVGKNGKVYCFEPHKEIVEKLRLNLYLNGLNNYKIYNIGLGEKNDDLEYNSVNLDSFEEGTVNSSFLDNEKISSASFKGKFTRLKTRVKKLDDILQEEDIKLVKIDTEGYELNILRGMPNLIKRCKPIIIFEWHSPRIEYLEIKLKSFQDLLLNDYNVYKILVHIKSNNIVLKEYKFENLDLFTGDLIGIPKNI